MKLYMAIRFGHAESPDGPDGADTVFLVRAEDYRDAARLTDEALLGLPTSSPRSQRPVESRCHRVLELGEDSSSASEPQLLGGPWIGGNGLFDSRAYRMWVRGDITDDWQDARDVFPDSYS